MCGNRLRDLAAQIHIGPSGPPPVTVSRDSPDHSILACVRRADPAERQVTPRTDGEVLDLAVRLNRERPARTAAHIARIMEADRGWAPSPHRTL
jgi:putative transposase